VPEISRFFGIVIAMYFNDHDPPHFHARYGEQRGRFAIEDLRMIDGTMSLRVRGLIIEWASQHQQELIDNWDRTRTRQSLRKIEPLE
jgi:hypothetical protein